MEELRGGARSGYGRARAAAKEEPGAAAKEEPRSGAQIWWRDTDGQERRAACGARMDAADVLATARRGGRGALTSARRPGDGLARRAHAA